MALINKVWKKLYQATVECHRQRPPAGGCQYCRQRLVSQTRQAKTDETI